MRRSAAPSKRLKAANGDEENDFSKAPCSQGLMLGGFMGVSNTAGVIAPAALAATQQQQQQQLQQRAPSLGLVPRPAVTQFKCPLPYGSQVSGGASRGSLGARKNYSGGAADLLASIQRRVVVVDSGPQAGSSNIVSELVLYDPEEHKLQWPAQQEAAAPAPAAGPTPSGTADTERQVEPTTAAGSQPPAAPSAAAPAAPPTQDNMAWEKRVKVYADPFLVERLRPHQREGVKFVFECLSGVRQQGISGAVLADGMGLGKTFQTLASLYFLLTKGVFGHPTCKKPLILCPTSLVQNWGKEVVKWLGDRLETVVVDDTRANKVKKYLQDFRAFNRTGKPRVLIMSYPCFRGHKAEVYKLGIDVLMCDEAHFLKNGDAQITQAVAGLSTQRRLLMSGTPIQNDLSEFHAVFDLACPGLLGTLNTFRKMYEGPIQRGRDADATDKQVDLGMQRMNELMKLCNKFMLRRTSTVLKELLPTKVEQVVFCKLSKLQLKLYEHFLQSKPVKALLASTMGEDGAPAKKRKPSKAQAAAAAAAAGSQPPDIQPEEEQQDPLLAPLAAITALKKLCCHPDLIWDMLHKHKAAEAKAQQLAQLAQMREVQKRVSARASALAPRSYALMASGCGSDGEADGGDTEGGAGSKKRPSKKAASKGSARQQLTGFEGCTHLFSDGDVYPAYQQGRCQAFHSGKVMVLEALLKSIRASEPTDKVVLVSNYTEVLDVLGVMCTSHNWVSLRLDGSCSVKQRQALVDSFNDPTHPSFVLLLSSKAGGVGLNIIGANRLVLFDPDWNPANDLQAMARVWREGQAKRVWIYRLLMAGSIEEKVLQRQLAKQGLSEALVDEVGQEVRTFSRDELRSLFKVNPNIPCETHCAIKCTCDGSLEAMAGCRERAAAVGGGADDAAEQQGILAWAHLAKALDSPDPTWGTMSAFARDNFVSYMFSDHVLGEQSSGAGALKAATAAAAAGGSAHAAAGAGKRRAPDSGSSSSSEAGVSDGEAEGSDSEEEDAEGAYSNGWHTAARTAVQQQRLPARPQQQQVGTPSSSTAASARLAAAGPAAAAEHKPTAAAAAAVSVPAADNEPAAAAGLPPKPKPAGGAVRAPAAARRRSASAALCSDKAANSSAAGNGTGAAARRRNSAPAVTKGSTKTGSKAGSKQGSGRAAAASAVGAAPELALFAYQSGGAATGGGGGAAAAAAVASLPGQVVDDSLAAELCPQLSDPLDDTPMDFGGGESSDGDFM